MPNTASGLWFYSSPTFVVSYSGWPTIMLTRSSQTLTQGYVNSTIPKSNPIDLSPLKMLQVTNKSGWPEIHCR